VAISGALVFQSIKRPPKFVSGSILDDRIDLNRATGSDGRGGLLGS
jgi:hypothetical protein